MELRLSHALDLQLLAPFEFHDCDKATDFSAVSWDKPCEPEAVDKVVPGNDMRSRLVVDKCRRLPTATEPLNI